MRVTYSEQKRTPNDSRTPARDSRIVSPVPEIGLHKFRPYKQQLKLESISSDDEGQVGQPSSSIGYSPGGKHSIVGEANIGGDADEEEFPTSV